MDKVSGGSLRFEEDEGRTMRRGWERTWVCGVKARDTEAEKSFSISSELQARSIRWRSY